MDKVTIVWVAIPVVVWIMVWHSIRSAKNKVDEEFFKEYFNFELPFRKSPSAEFDLTSRAVELFILDKDKDLGDRRKTLTDGILAATSADIAMKFSLESRMLDHEVEKLVRAKKIARKHGLYDRKKPPKTISS